MSPIVHTYRTNSFAIDFNTRVLWEVDVRVKVLTQIERISHEHILQIEILENTVLYLKVSAVLNDDVSLKH